MSILNHYLGGISSQTNTKFKFYNCIIWIEMKLKPQGLDTDYKITKLNHISKVILVQM